MDDWHPFPSVLALDPGGTTGWSVITVHPDSLGEEDVRILDNIEHWESGEITGDENNQVGLIVEMLEAWPDAAVVIEDFVLGSAIRDRDLLSPVRITAKVDYLLWMEERRYFTQLAGVAMSAATDARLKAWNLYRREGGQGHARDATRHAITFLRRAKERPKLRALAWPQHYEAPMQKAR